MKIWIIFMHDVLDIPQESTILIYSEEYDGMACLK